MLTGGSASGLSPRVAGAFCYPLSIVTGVLFLLIEKDNRFVRFHAWQSILLFIVYLGCYSVVSVAGNILSILPLIGDLFWYASRFINQLLSLGMGIVSVFLIFKAFQEER